MPDVDQDLEDLLGFLADTDKRRASVRVAAVDILTGLAATAEGTQRLKANLHKVLTTLMRFLCDEDPAVARGVLAACVNLSQDAAMAEGMLKLKAVSRIMDILKDNNSKQPQLLVMWLNNLTTTDAGCSELLQLGQGKLEGLNMAVLLKRFVMAGMMWSPDTPQDDYEHVAPILTNVTRTQAARQLLLQPGRGLLQVLAGQLKAPSLLRRQGAAGALKNCCMSAEADGSLEHLLADATALRVMLGPISGQAPGEPDATVREAMAESVMVLAASAAGRKALWAVGAPDLLKKGYEEEQHPETCRALEHTAELLLIHGGLSEEAEQTDQAGQDAHAGLADPQGQQQEQQSQPQDGQPAHQPGCQPVPNGLDVHVYADQGNTACLPVAQAESQAALVASGE